jgi:2-succinyl-5-enolpyruvyl-6-hydroxy-3-cyclohexene-1-carboxylate synthase
MIYPKIPLAQTLIQLCKAKQIKHIVLSPGSRNAPLTIGFTHDPFFKCYSIVDERCAAFFALGIAQQLQEPIAVVCTSGSALLNYFPAVAEAFYSNIPLVVLSADRPKYMVGIGDGQTINQREVYGTHVAYAANLKDDIPENKTFTKAEKELPIFKNLEHKLEKALGLQQSVQDYNETEINNALNTAILEKLPVHINCPFNEPLYDRVDTLTVNVSVVESQVKEPDFTQFENFNSVWQSSHKKMVLVGVLEPNSLEENYINLLANDPSVLILTESTSNFHHEKTIPSIDKLIGALNEDEFVTLQPDVLLTVGGLVVSKKIKQFLRKYQPKHHYHLGLHQANNTFYILNHWFKISLNTFFSHWQPLYKDQESSFQNFWISEMNLRRNGHSTYMSQIPYSDFKVFHHIINALPETIQIQSANSSIIRYLQLFDFKKTQHIFCNRGTSGIDGSTSTAIGAAITTKTPTVCITGDLSFLYDSNALWNNYIPKNFKIILINNAGGGIFRILPGHKNTENFDTYFETKHNLNASHLAKMYQFNYNKVSGESELKEKLSHFFSSNDAPQLLEIFTPSHLNDEVLLGYFKAIKY